MTPGPCVFALAARSLACYPDVAVTFKEGMPVWIVCVIAVVIPTMVGFYIIDRDAPYHAPAASIAHHDR